MAWCVAIFCGVGVAAGLDNSFRVWVKSGSGGAAVAAESVQNLQF